MCSPCARWPASPPEELPAPTGDGPLVLLPLTQAGADLVDSLDGADLDDPARACVREIRDGGSPAPAELAFDTDDDGEPQFVLYTVWDPQPVRELARLSEGRFKERHGRFFRRDAGSGATVPADPALIDQLEEFAADPPRGGDRRKGARCAGRAAHRARSRRRHRGALLRRGR